MKKEVSVNQLKPSYQSISKRNSGLLTKLVSHLLA